jgi:hypothetical protein
MNKRIRELAEQAGLVGGGYANGTKIMTWRESVDNPGSLEKFAELVIEECANLCEQRYVEHKDLSDESVEAMMCCNTIREHFGVEL